MTDHETANLVRQGRREGFQQALKIAFYAALAATPVGCFLAVRVREPYAASVIVAVWILTTLAIASFVTNSDPV